MHNDRKLRRKVRNSYIISTVSMALVLFLLGSVGYLIITALDATDRLKESVSVYVMLEDGVNDQRRAEVGELLAEQQLVREAVFVSKDHAAREFKEYAGDDFEHFLDFNPLPDSYEVKLRAAGPDMAKLRAFEKEVATWDGVDEVVYQRNVVEQIGSNINKFNLILLLFGGTLLVISLILLNNTIRVSIFSKRYVISTMKLVGATRGFIIWPFLWSAILQGVYSALLAAALFAAMVWGLHEGLPEIRFGAASGAGFGIGFGAGGGMNLGAALGIGQSELCIMGGMLVLGIVISLTFTYFAVNKFIKMPTGAIHYY